MTPLYELHDVGRAYGPVTVVEVTLRDGEVCVRDHGPGVPPEEAALVFDRFYRGDGARGRHGSGLGLAIVRQVAESHGGTASVEQPPGGGARFRLALPTTRGSDPLLPAAGPSHGNCGVRPLEGG